MQHYTRGTIEVSEWCAKCGKNTMHGVNGVKLGACKECLARLLKEGEDRRRQGNLFAQ